jgi:hypothetical protein
MQTIMMIEKQTKRKSNYIKTFSRGNFLPSFFKIRTKGSNKPVPSLTPQKNIYKIIDLIALNTFKFESETYRSGFGKPLMFGKEILVVPYYNIVKEEVREDVINKENPGEIKPEIRLMPVQKVRYIRKY